MGLIAVIWQAASEGLSACVGSCCCGCSGDGSGGGRGGRITVGVMDVIWQAASVGCRAGSGPVVSQCEEPGVRMQWYVLSLICERVFMCV